MKVRVLKGFAGLAPDGRQVSYGEGDEFELPEGADWLKAGLVEAVDEAKVEAVEFAVSVREEKRKPVKKTG